MKRYFLLRWLVVPLGIAATASMLLSLFLQDPWRSLLVNLAASFLGSTVTVFYVDRILRRNEEHRWERVRGHVGKQVTILANATASSVRTALHMPAPESFFNDPDASSDPARMREVMTELIEHDLLPGISTLLQMDRDDWRIFASNLRGCMLHCERLISLFGDNLDPTITGLILDLHEKAGEVVTPYQLLPEELGVPFEELKPNRRGESSAPLIKAMVVGAIRDTGQLLRICARLLREIGTRFPDRSLAQKID